jgi:hypothetical protein
MDNMMVIHAFFNVSLKWALGFYTGCLSNIYSVKKQKISIQGGFNEEKKARHLVDTESLQGFPGENAKGRSGG